jgi:hypothetical protein
MTRAVLDPQSAARLVKLCGMLGSQHHGERAAAAFKADQFIRGLGLTWSDIVIPSHQVPANDWQRIANYCLMLRDQLNEREMRFVESIARYRGAPSDKQQHWLSKIYARLSGGAR